MDALTLMNLDIHKYFEYIQSIRYGYSDTRGKLHFPGDEDFHGHKYSFSHPCDILKNNCGWCWDISYMTCEYCKANGIEYRHIFLEYISGGIHQTHTQVFLMYDGKWYAAPDNSSDEGFGVSPFSSYADVLEDFKNGFCSYIEHAFKVKCAKSALTVNDITNKFIERGTNDEDIFIIFRS